MKVLLLGGNGQVGHELRRSLARLGTVVVSTRSGELADGTVCEALDLAELDSIGPLIERIAPDVVVNATAYTTVDRAEDEPKLAFRINAEAPAKIAAACARGSAALVHYSTDYVFDGSGSCPYREDDATAPLGVYGASKWEGEKVIATSGAHHLILRTAWAYATHGRNFLRTMLRLANEGAEIRVVTDQVGTPTPAWLVADVTACILEQGIDGGRIRHLVTEGQTSWHGFAEAIMDEAHARGLIARKPRVLPVTTADFPTRAQRPAYSVLDTSGLRRDYGLELPDWRHALATTLDRPLRG